MALTDPKLLYSLIGIFLVIFGSTIVLWGKLSKSTFKLIALRTISLLSLNFLIVGICGLAINGRGNFYTSWNELLGKNEKPVIVSEQSAKRITSSDLDNAEFTKSGTAIIKKLVKGEKSKVISHIYISIPSSLVSAIKNGAKSRDDYRVIEYLPGYPGKAAAWVHGMAIATRQDEATKGGKLPEVIAVAPEINVAGKFDAECMNIPDGKQIETWLSDDVVSLVNDWLSLRNQPWGIAGYSTGAWCATMLSLRHPDTYQFAAAIAGYYSPLISRKIPENYHQQLLSEYDIFSILKDRPPAVHLYVVNSVDDPSSHAPTELLLKRIQKPVDVTEVILSGAGHNFQAWKRTLTPMLEWFGKQMKVQP